MFVYWSKIRFITPIFTNVKFKAEIFFFIVNARKEKIKKEREMHDQ